MKNIHSALVAAIMIAVAAIGAYAQNNVFSPYSRYGYGSLTDYASSSQRAMGGVGYAMNNGRQINVMNPASYAAIDTLTFLFDMGVDFKQINLEQGTEKGHKFTGGLDYITMQFPLGRYMGGSIGLLPWSEVGYAFGNEIVNGEEAYQGSGSINELYLGLSGQPVKGLTVGAHIGYLFGTLLHDTYLTPATSSTTLFEHVTAVKDFNLRFGLQYSFNIGQRNRVTLGAVYSPRKDFLGDTYGVYYDVNSDAKPDTIGQTSMRGKFSRPDTYGGGINYQWNNRLMVEADFTYQPWKDAKYTETEGFETSRFNDRWRGAIGIQFQPDPRGNYLKRMRYRIGAYMDQDYIMVGDNSVKDLGITCGFGLPAPINRLTKTVVNIGFEYRRRTSSPVALVTENYFQVTLGINFNELWFWQNKIQ